MFSPLSWKSTLKATREWAQFGKEGRREGGRLCGTTTSRRLTEGSRSLSRPAGLPAAWRQRRRRSPVWKLLSCLAFFLLLLFTPTLFHFKLTRFHPKRKTFQAVTASKDSSGDAYCNLICFSSLSEFQFNAALEMQVNTRALILDVLFCTLGTTF